MEIKWISFEDKPPNSSKKVLVTNGIDIMIGFYCDICNIIEHENIEVAKVSHWMPLPKLPFK